MFNQKTVDEIVQKVAAMYDIKNLSNEQLLKIIATSIYQTYEQYEDHLKYVVLEHLKSELRREVRQS